MKIVNFKKVDHQTIKANFDIEFSIGTVKSFKLVNSNGKTFISMPSVPVDINGEKKYKRYYVPPEGKEEDFQRKVLTLLDPYIKQNQHGEDQEHPF